MPSSPLAYFITFTTYGTWLHGRAPGSVDRFHNEVGTPFLPPDEERERAERDGLAEPPYLLDEARREIVLQTILEVARHRGWTLWAVHVRSNHVHIVVTADARPEKVMSDFKAYASRRLREQFDEPGDRTRWTQHGSTLYLWSDEQVGAKVEYIYGKHSGAVVVEHALRGAGITPEPKLVARVLEEVKRIREERAERADFSEFHRNYYEHLGHLGLTAAEVVDIARAISADSKAKG